MSSASVWDDEYARLARAASQLRTQGLTSSNDQQRQLHVGLSRLDASLTSLSLPAVEVQRRRRLVQGLQQQQQPPPQQRPNSTNNNHNHNNMSNNNAPQQQSQMATAMRQQDDMIDQLATGVSRLRDQTQVIGDEAHMHNRLLGDMEENLDAAHAGLEGETRRAAQLKEDQSVWKLQLTVAGLSVLLVLLILMGIS
jgi:hypothetical protein